MVRGKYDAKVPCIFRPFEMIYNEIITIYNF